MWEECQRIFLSFQSSSILMEKKKTSDKKCLLSSHHILPFLTFLPLLEAQRPSWRWVLRGAGSEPGRESAGCSCVFFRAVSLLVTESAGRPPRSPAAPSVMEILRPLSSSLPSPALFALCRHSAFTFAPFKSLGGASSLLLSVRLIDGQPLPSALGASLSLGKPVRAALRYFAANTQVIFNKWENQQKRTNKQTESIFFCRCRWSSAFSKTSAASAVTIFETLRIISPGLLSRGASVLTLLYTLITKHDLQKSFLIFKKNKQTLNLYSTHCFLCFHITDLHGHMVLPCFLRRFCPFVFHPHKVLLVFEGAVGRRRAALWLLSSAKQDDL